MPPPYRSRMKVASLPSWTLAWVVLNGYGGCAGGLGVGR